MFAVLSCTQPSKKGVMISSISKIHQDAIKKLRVTGSVQNVRRDWSHKIYSNHFSVLASQALQEIDNKGFLHFWRLAAVGNLCNSEMDEIKTRRACSEGSIYLIIRGAERVIFFVLDFMYCFGLRKDRVKRKRNC